MSNKITKINKDQFKNTIGLSDDFEWGEIGNFSVIAGKNGSGKTRLLEKIYNTYYRSRGLKVQYIPIGYRFNVNNNFSNNPHIKDGDQSNLSDIWNEMYDRSRSEADTATSKYILNERQKFIKDSENHLRELDRINQFNQTSDLSKLLPEKKEDYWPWDYIDEVIYSPSNFEGGFGLNILLDRENLNHKIYFKKNNNTQIEIDKLSSGEQVAVAISFWLWASEEGAKTELLLIDEFDAHLNPCLMKSFVATIKKYFVDKDVQVIMTTHSPITASYALNEGADLIWMEDGLINDKKEAKDIIEDLSGGLVSAKDLMQDVVELVNDVGSHKDILYTEGKTDPVYLKAAIKIFNLEDKFKNIHIMGCLGDVGILSFVKLKIGKKKVALFDNPDFGSDIKRAADRVTRKLEIKEEGCVILHINEEFNEIECLFGEVFLSNPYNYFYENLPLSNFSEKFNKNARHFNSDKKKFRGDKAAFAKKMREIVDDVCKSENSSQKEEVQKVFQDFEPLLQKIINAFDEKANF